MLEKVEEQLNRAAVLTPDYGGLHFNDGIDLPDCDVRRMFKMSLWVQYERYFIYSAGDIQSLLYGHQGQAPSLTAIKPGYQAVWIHLPFNNVGILFDLLRKKTPCLRNR